MNYIKAVEEREVPVPAGSATRSQFLYWLHSHFKTRYLRRPICRQRVLVPSHPSP